MFGYLYNPTYVGPTCIRTCVRARVRARVRTYVRVSLRLSIDLMFCMSTASMCLPVLRLVDVPDHIIEDVSRSNSMCY